MSHVIRAECVSKHYSRRKPRSDGRNGFWSRLAMEAESVSAVRRLSFEVRQGESVGLIGENGAGKSTTIKMLTGLLVPSEGKLQTLGLDPWKHRRRLALSMGVVFGQRTQLFWDIPPGETFRLLKAMYGVSDDVYRYSYTEAVERLELGGVLKTPVRLLSLGQRMRCDLVAALLHAPKLAFLDEPTIGVDVIMKDRVRDFLTDMRRRFGTTILMTTHDLKDIAATCERLLVLDKGGLIYDGGLEGFAATAGIGRSVLVELKSVPPEAELALLERELAAEGAVIAAVTPQRLRINFGGTGVAPRVVALVLARLAVTDLSLQGADIEAMVTQFYGNSRQGN